MASNEFYSGNTQRAPPPPPRQAIVRGTSAAKKVSQPRQTTYQSIRAKVSTGVDEKANDNDTTIRAPKNSAYSRITRNKPTLSARSKPVASRPVGSYYNTSTAAPTATPITTTGTDVTANNNDNDRNNTWDDWSTADNSTPTTTAASNQHSSWAPSNSYPATTATTNDTGWYSAGGSTAATTIAATGAVSSIYTSVASTNSSATQSQTQQPLNPGNGFYQNNVMSQEQQQQPLLSGAMDSSAPTIMTMNANSNSNSNINNTDSNAMPSFSMFMPSASTQQQQQDGSMYPSLEDEAPLLEELGINIQHILLKIKAVVFPFSHFGGEQIDPSVICQDGDLPGPIFLLLLLGGEMVLTGKLQFSFIYVYALFGCILMTLVVNLISPSDSVSFWTVTSIMGYSLLPVNILALVKIVIMNLIHLETFGNILGGFTVLYSTIASTRLLELGCGLRSQRYLIAYPLLLFYSAFVMMTIF